MNLKSLTTVGVLLLVGCSGESVESQDNVSTSNAISQVDFVPREAGEQSEYDELVADALSTHRAASPTTSLQAVQIRSTVGGTSCWPEISPCEFVRNSVAEECVEGHVNEITSYSRLGETPLAVTIADLTIDDRQLQLVIEGGAFTDNLLTGSPYSIAIEQDVVLCGLVQLSEADAWSVNFPNLFVVDHDVLRLDPGAVSLDGADAIEMVEQLRSDDVCLTTWIQEDVPEPLFETPEPLIYGTSIVHHGGVPPDSPGAVYMPETDDSDPPNPPEVNR